MQPKAMDLFEAYSKKELPMDEGYIVSSFFKDESAYSIYEIISYSAIKDIYVSGNGLTFHTSGKKLHILVEPSNYPEKGMEPYCRKTGFIVPLRFKESDIITARNQSRIIFSRKPQDAISAFTVLKPEGVNFSFLFYPREDVFESLEVFLTKTLNMEAAVPQKDAATAAASIAALAAKELTWPKEED